LGNMQITALHHPGHTKGATSFIFDIVDSNKTYRVLIANMPSIVFEDRFSDLKTYPDAARDYATTFKQMRKVKFDLWLASHSSQFGLHEKHKETDSYNPEKFSDRKGYDKAIDKLYNSYKQKLNQR